MLFNSYIYIIFFLPIACLSYFYFAKRSVHASKIWLVICSLFFYGWWDVSYVPLILISATFNYYIGRMLVRTNGKKHKSYLLLVIGISANILTLCYFKYADFIVSNVGVIFNQSYPSFDIVLPLAISFFTFQQVAYLVDCYSKEAKEYDFTNYMVFVCFFPQLIAGPIVHHKEMMPQFEEKKNLRVNHINITLGLLIFSIGMFKKVVLADSFAVWATDGFDETVYLSFLEAWGTSLSYTLQLYFDFSGYTDMAIGSALFFNIRLPFNFNSPYKSRSIREFWQSWHMTLSRFLRDYLYIPLGGSHCSKPRIYLNIFITFLLGGLWHGAAWTFVIWGGLHGGALVLQRVWAGIGLTMPRLFSWFITFMFVNASWVVFRAESFADAKKVWSGMLDIGSFEPINYLWLSALIVGVIIVTAAPNTNRLRDIKEVSHEIVAIIAGILLFISILFFEVRQTSEFLYFQF